MDSGSSDERKVRDVINSSKTFTWKGSEYEVIVCVKPTSEKGEPKTDTYIKARNTSNGKLEEIKISTKNEDWSAMENKVTADRAFHIYGSKYEDIVKKQNSKLKDKFLSAPLIYFQKKKRTQKGTIALGWRYEIMYESAKKKPNGSESGLREMGVRIEEEVYPQIFWGEGCTPRHRDAKVNGITVLNSGIPDWIFIKNKEGVKGPQDIFDHLHPIKEFAKTHKDLDVTYLAHNYRTSLKKKCDCGNEYRWILSKCPKCNSTTVKNKSSVAIQGMKRELPIWTKWDVVGGKLKGTVIIDKPFKVADEVVKNLQNCLEQIGIPDNKNFDIKLLEGKLTNDTIAY